MASKRFGLTVATAVGCGAITAAARADVILPFVTQDQANRLSIFHDYGMDVIGDATGDGSGVAGHGGGYLGTVPEPGIPGHGAAAAAIDKFSGTFPFLRGIQSTDSTGTGRSYDLSVGYASGTDSNPEARAHPHDASFFGGSLAAAYHLTRGDVDPVVGVPFRADLAYTATGVFYSGPRADADAVQQGLGGFVRSSYADNAVVLTGGLNDQFTMEHGAAFLDTFDGTAAAEGFVLNQLSVEGGYDYGHLQYFFKPAGDDAARPTAERHTLDARLHVYTISQHRGDPNAVAKDGTTRFIQGALRRATLGYAHVFNFPDQQTGTDYRYQSDRVYIGLEGLALPPEVQLFGQPLGQGTSASILYAHEFQTFAFDNSNSPAVQTGTGPGHPRKDGLDVLTLRSNTRILDFAHKAGTLVSFLQFDLVHDGSNIPNRHFNENVFSTGLTYQY